MKKLKINKKFAQLSVSILVAVFVFAPFGMGKSFKASIAAAQEDYSDYDWFDDSGYEHIDGEANWSGDHIIEKGVYIDNGGILNIEKGTRVLFRNNPDQKPWMSIWGNGRIVVNGSQNEKVVFSSTESGGQYAINFYTNDDAQQSFFRYVDFVGTGTNVIDGSGGVALLRRLITETAIASTSFSPVFAYQSGRVHFENSTFHDGSISIDMYVGLGDGAQVPGNNENSFIEVVNSNFELGESGIAVNSGLSCDARLSDADCKKHILLKNNWYGSAAGPLFDLNIDNPVDRSIVYGKLMLDGWRSSDLIVDPVLIVPGIMGAGEFLGDWQLDPIMHTYDDLVSSLETNGFTKDANLFDFPYEWKNNNETSANYLQARVEGIINTTRVSRVDVVAHSMGGLVARAYIEGLGGTTYENTIDELITIGTPNHGSPKSYLYYEAGEGFFSMIDNLTRHHFKQEAEHAGYNDLGKYIQEKIHSVGQLLPDYNYLFDVSLLKMRNYPENYPRNTFLEELNSDINLEKMRNVQYVNIFGNFDGKDNTISKIKVTQSDIEGKWIDGMPEEFYNTNKGLEFDYGDETVPTQSATGIPSDKNISIDSTHQNIPDAAQCDVVKELTGKTDCRFVDDWHITNFLLFNVFSPIDIQVISPSGKKYGKDFENNKNFESIDGSFYTGFDTENEFITIPNPEDGEYRIITKGTGDGEYRLEVTQLSEDPIDSNETIESTTIINGVAMIDKAAELKIEVKENLVTDKNAPIVPPVVPPAPPIIPPVTPPVVPVIDQSQGAANPAPIAKKKKSHKKSSHKKKSKKSKTNKVVTRAKKVLGISTNKNIKQKNTITKSWNYVAKKSTTAWQNTVKAATNLRDFLFKPFKYFKR